MREYELMYVLVPDLPEEGVTAATERINGLITNRGGEITRNDPMGRRRMAYPIRRHLDGLYTVLRFMLDPQQTDEIDRNLRLNEQVLRHIIVHAVEVPPPRTIRRVREADAPRMRDGEAPRMRDGEPPRMRDGEPPRPREAEAPRPVEAEAPRE